MEPKRSRTLLSIYALVLSMVIGKQAIALENRSLATDPDIQAYLGLWKTIDDKTQKPRSLIRLSIEGSQLVANIEKVYARQGEPQKPICEKCSGELKNVDIIGLNILKGMIYDNEQWHDGEILDPDNGKFYDAKIWLEQDTLKVRGYVGFFFRTQQWHRYRKDSD